MYICLSNKQFLAHLRGPLFSVGDPGSLNLRNLRPLRLYRVYMYLNRTLDRAYMYIYIYIIYL